MPWVRFEDDFPIHRKVAGLTDAAYRLHTEAICWCSRNLTDGVIRSLELDQIKSRASRSTPDLVSRLLWHTADQHCEPCRDRLTTAGRAWPPDGWIIHDYLGYQPSAVQVTKERTAKAERQRRYMDKARRGKDASVDTSRDASADVTPTRPAPPRREAGRGPVATARRRSAADASGDGREEQPANGHPPAVPPAQILDEVRKRLRQASTATKARGTRREGALDELRALTDPPPGDTE